MGTAGGVAGTNSQDTSNTVKMTVLNLGGTAVTATAAELNILDTVTATAAELNYLDLTTLGTGANSKAVVVDASGDYKWPAGIVTHEQATDALILGCGNSSAHKALGVTAGTALEFRFTGTNTTGDMRGMYLRMNYEGEGGSGEALRVYSVLNGVTGATAGTINGAHISLDVRGANGTIQGQGSAVRATIGFDSAFTGAGKISGILLDTAINSSATISGVQLSAIRLATADSKKWPVFVDFDGVVGASNAIKATTSAMGTASTTHALHILIDGVSGYIPVFVNSTWS